jgi:CBS domain-containing protein
LPSRLLILPTTFSSFHTHTPNNPTTRCRFAAYNIGALAVTDAEGKVIGVISERDYVCKVSERLPRERERKIGRVREDRGACMYACMHACM